MTPATMTTSATIVTPNYKFTAFSELLLDYSTQSGVLSFVLFQWVELSGKSSNLKEEVKFAVVYSLS